VNIGVVGGGIAGLASAYYLDSGHDVTLFEARDYIGGHTNTVAVTVGDRDVTVDTGFIVYNEQTYPLFMQLLDDLDVETRETTMSFSVRCDQTDFEYAGHNLNSLFAQRSNFYNVDFYRMIADILRFNHEAPKRLDEPNPPDTLGDYLSGKRYSELFVEKYLIPMAAAIWSSPRTSIRAFPFRTLVRFFDHHGLLQITNRPTWRFLKDGAHQYVHSLRSRLDGTIRSNTPVVSVERTGNRVRIRTESGDSYSFDGIIIAVHSDQALSMLESPRPLEKSVLSTISFHSNNATLHTDPTVMPERKNAWSAWNVLLSESDEPSIHVSYNMNILQQLDTAEPLIVSLNMNDRISSDKILRRFTYRHPIYDLQSNRARNKIDRLNKQNSVCYAGAYWDYGFHEDGVRSARRAATSLVRSIA